MYSKLDETTVKEISGYTKNTNYKPLYSVNIGDEYYLGVGNYKTGKLFKCSSFLADLSYHFLGTIKEEKEVKETLG